MARSKEFPSKVSGDKKNRHFEAKITPSETTSRNCSMCGGHVVRSWRTGILHKMCFTCRYLVMIYGPSISVRRIDPPGK